MMKKVFLSLLMTLVCLPALFAQANAGHVIKIDSITTCHDYTWERNDVTYTQDTVDIFTKGDTTFILNLVKLTSFLDTANAIQVAGECSATWGAKTWTKSGTFFDTLMSVEGCDSVVKLNVSIASIDTVRDVEICGSYTAPWGQTYTESATIDTLIIHGTCTYHNTINLTVHPAYNGIEEEVISGCYYQWGDTLITDTDPHTRIFKTVDYLCDSIVTLTVTTMTGEQYDTLKVYACDSYKPAWRSAVTTSGYYSTDSVITVNGESCNKHFTIDLTIVESNNDTASVTPLAIEAGCSYVWEGETITDEEIHYHLYKSVLGGCDSLAAIQLNFTGKTYDTTHVEYCGSSYTWKNSNLPGNSSKYVYTTDTIAKDSVTNDGCTTVYVLDLKFIKNYDTIAKYYCGDSYTYSYTKLNDNGSTQNASTKFTEGGYHTVSAEGDTMYSVNSSTGCKTVRTLNLNLHIPEIRYRSHVTVAEACERYRFKADNLNGKWITFTSSCDTDVVHQQRSQNIETQCYDSIAHLTLTIYKNTTTNTSKSACDSYTWVANNNDTLGTYTASGSYRDTLDEPNADGCLQIANLKLTIYKTPTVDIQGKWMLEPGESTVLTAVPSVDSDPISSYKWFVDDVQASTTETLELNNVTKNTDVRLESTATHGSLKCIALNWITVTSNLSIDEVEALHVNIYPNPASRFLNIESAEGISEVVIYNTVGQQVMSRTANSDAIQLDLGNLANGNYTMRIVGNDGNQTTRKFIINK